MRDAATIETERSAAGPEPRRALIVKVGSIGDVVMAIPGAAQLHAAGFAIDWVASEAIAPVLRLYPWIHVLAIDETRLLRGTLPERLRAATTLINTLRGRVRQARRPYDLIATLYFDPRYHWLTRAVPARRRVNLSRTDRRFDLLPGRHHVEEYARILTGRSDAVTPSQLAPVRPPLLAATPHPGPRTVVLFPAGARNVLRDDALRRWPLANYVQLADDLLTHTACDIVLAGGEADCWALEPFAALLNGPNGQRCHDLIGQSSLVETLALLDAAAVTVTHDTGPLHLAGLTSTAVVTIFGPTDPHGRLPWRPNSVALWGGEGFACRPCYDGRDYAPCPDNACMAQITSAMVASEVKQLLEARANGLEQPPKVILPPAAGFVDIGDIRP